MSKLLQKKGKVLATTHSDSKNSNSDVEWECDSDGNYLAFMEITTVDSRDELSELVDDLGVHSKEEEVDVSDDEVCTLMRESSRSVRCVALRL